MEFQPLHPNLPAHFWIALIVAIGTGLFTAWILMGKSPWKGQLSRQVLPLWTFILCLLAVGTAFFSFWNHMKVGPVKFDAEGMETPYGKALYGDISRVYIHQERDKSLIDPNMVRSTTNWLIIEERGGKKHALSQDQYNLAEIEKALEGFLDEENRN